MISLSQLAAALVLFVATQVTSTPTPPDCRPSGTLVELRDLPEASGVAASRRTPGVFWAHNDSGEPILFALDRTGTITARVGVTGARVDDWEDIAVGPCAGDTCLYIADIGDNDGRRKSITIYRTREPGIGDRATAPVERFHAIYPDTPHDAEALIVTPREEVLVITKGDPGPVAVYRIPQLRASDTPLRLERIAGPPSGAELSARDRPTAADVSPDSAWIAIRTTHWLAFHRTADLLAGRWREVSRLDLTRLEERRGEGVTFDGAEAIVLVGEAGSLAGRSGTFARLTCTPPR
jgi:hypothetical protein